MVYINTIREWQDILAIVPWTSLKKIIDFFILYKTEKAWQLPRWLCLSLREDGSRCSSEIAKWCGFIVQFYLFRRGGGGGGGGVKKYEFLQNT